MRLDHLLSKEHTPPTINECLVAHGGVSLVESSTYAVQLLDLRPQYCLPGWVGVEPGRGGGGWVVGTLLGV